MACRGVLFALTKDEESKLLQAKDDTALRSVVQDEIEERWDRQHLLELDKAWDAIDRCLDGGALTMAILGGHQLHQGDSYIVAHKTAHEVREIARALEQVTADKIRTGFATLRSTDYEGPADEQDLQYTLDYFADLPLFYARAAAEGRSVIFTVDQ